MSGRIEAVVESTLMAAVAADLDQIEKLTGGQSDETPS